jgi:hypothetical protein
MTFTDEKRLAIIRRQSALWCSVDPRAKYWNDAFLLKLLDRRSSCDCSKPRNRPKQLPNK